jgi:hypothetical protein
VVLILGVVVLGAGLAARLWGQHRLRQAKESAREAFAGLSLDNCRAAIYASGDDAAPLLRAGAAAWSISEKDISFLGHLSARPSSSWSQEEEGRARSLLAGQTTALELFHRAVEGPFAVSPVVTSTDTPGVDPILLTLMRSARLLAVHAQLAASTGDTPVALASLTALATLATSLQNSDGTLPLLVGSAAEKLLHRALQRFIEDPATDITTYQHLAAIIPDSDIKVRWRCALLRDRAVSEARVAREVEASGGGRTSSILQRLSPFAPLMEAQLVALDARLARAIDEPYGHKPDWSTQPSRWRDGVVPAIVAPNLIGAAARSQHLLASRQLVRTAIALRQLGLARGSYPPALDAVPGADLPDPFTGERLHYALDDHGGAILSSPGTEQLLGEIVATDRVGLPSPTRFHLPPLAPPSAP